MSSLLVQKSWEALLPMDINSKDLAEQNFKLTHWCQLDTQGSLKFIPAPDGNSAMLTSNAPMVYLWLSPKDKFFEALYVGKAGLGVSQRLRNHESGFRKSSTGKKHLENIKNILEMQREVMVFARKSETCEILGVKINLYSAEEEAIHELFRPTWNRAQFPAGRKQNQQSIQSTEDTQIAMNAGAIEPCVCKSPCICSDLDLSAVLRGQLLYDFHNGLDPINQDRLCHILRWALGLEASQAAGMKVVMNYTGQPTGYNNDVATFVIALLEPSGRAVKNGWVLRIPLRCDDLHPLTITMPTDKMGTQVLEPQIARGHDENFRPLELDDFIARPNYYTTLV
jgi:hypothetical protein